MKCLSGGFERVSKSRKISNGRLRLAKEFSFTKDSSIVCIIEIKSFLSRNRMVGSLYLLSVQVFKLGVWSGKFFVTKTFVA